MAEKALVLNRHLPSPKMSSEITHLFAASNCWAWMHQVFGSW